MPTLYISNAFSVSMVGDAIISIKKIRDEEAKQLLTHGFVSAVGHESTAKVMSAKLGMSIQVNRVQVQLSPGDKLIVFQLLKRLEEGKVLNEDELRTIPAEWRIVEVISR